MIFFYHGKRILFGFTDFSQTKHKPFKFFSYNHPGKEERR